MMINDIYGIKDFQTNLPAIARKIREVGGHYLVSQRNNPAFVAIPFSDYQEIADIIMELNSPKLLKDIEKGRKDYREGKAKTFDEVLAALHDK